MGGDIRFTLNAPLDREANSMMNITYVYINNKCKPTENQIIMSLNAMSPLNSSF